MNVSMHNAKNALEQRKTGSVKWMMCRVRADAGILFLWPALVA